MSQSLTAQLLRWLALLCLAVFALHQSPALVQLMAGQATNAGCHQGDAVSPDQDHSHHHHHSHH